MSVFCSSDSNLSSSRKGVCFLVGYVEARPCWPIPRKKEESERLRGERDQIKFIDLGFERWQVVRLRKARGGQDFP